MTAEDGEADIKKSGDGPVAKLILDTKESNPPVVEEVQLPHVDWKGFTVGKSVERVNPVT
jgi:hypothetical protein